jgi:hypothetical protein
MAKMGQIALAYDPGVRFEDIWEPSVLSVFPSYLFDCLKTPHCLLLAAFSCASCGTDLVTLRRLFAVSSLMFFSLGRHSLTPLAQALHWGGTR